ncbi:hypothetical protein J8273_5494 [Carpediemonas membranifera]|uniref:Uncharacterized protein n=1 Tax=Carpediemonas membranifera TaxID=201153 RepID=A0A8J6E0P9_9EUKA|nr:hypothetical protein J8273_5494 [Carpediemonas membranifera]|eukprot:KAG9392498.1 hypothetical protein J8273_5494 [Carpediemonas membranifera]
MTSPSPLLTTTPTKSRPSPATAVAPRSLPSNSSSPGMATQAPMSGSRTTRSATSKPSTFMPRLTRSCTFRGEV